MSTYQVYVLTPWRSAVGRNDMLIAEEYPASWSDQAAQLDEQIGSAKLNRLVAVGQHLSAAQMAALQADARFAVLSVVEEVEEGEAAQPPAALTPEQATALQAEIATVLSSDVARLVMDEAAQTAPEAITAAVVEVIRRPPWITSAVVAAGEVYYYAGNLYEVIQFHTTQADWTPPVCPALFKRYYEPADDPWPWVQPLGAHDAYPLGARVTHNGSTWVSAIAANVWEPGSVGAESLWTREGEEPPPAVEPWVQPTGAHDAYNIGDRVSFEGGIYESLIDANVWSPVAYPAGWQYVGPA